MNVKTKSYAKIRTVKRNMKISTTFVFAKSSFFVGQETFAISASTDERKSANVG